MPERSRCLPPTRERRRWSQARREANGPRVSGSPGGVVGARRTRSGEAKDRPRGQRGPLAWIGRGTPSLDLAVALPGTHPRGSVSRVGSPTLTGAAESSDQPQDAAHGEKDEDNEGKPIGSSLHPPVAVPLALANAGRSPCTRRPDPSDPIAPRTPGARPLRRGAERPVRSRGLVRPAGSSYGRPERLSAAAPCGPRAPRADAWWVPARPDRIPVRLRPVAGGLLEGRLAGIEVLLGHRHVAELAEGGHQS